MTPEEARNKQKWRGMDGTTAWHLIDRHADNWSEIGLMMNAWLEANQKPNSIAQAIRDAAVNGIGLQNAEHLICNAFLQGIEIWRLDMGNNNDFQSRTFMLLVAEALES